MALRFEGRLVQLVPLDEAHVPALLEVARRGRQAFAMTYVPGDETAMRAYVHAALADARERQGDPVRDDRPGRGPRRRLDPLRQHRALAVAAGAIPLQRPPDRPDAVEIGWTWIDPAAQRTGINVEAKLLMLTHAFEAWQVHRVSLMTDARNTRCREAIVRLGATLDGVLRAARPAADDAIRDTAAYSIVRAEWPACKAALARRLR